MTLLGRLLRASPTRADRWALAFLTALPAVLNLPFALAGRPLMGGDNLDQNFPLRVLSGQLIAHGRLPLWNPDIWGGAPLLAGWNAGALYPGTWLFAVLPGVAALGEKEFNATTQPIYEQRTETDYCRELEDEQDGRRGARPCAQPQD